MNRLVKYLKEDKSVYGFITDSIKGNLSHAYLVTAKDYSTVNSALHLLAQTILCPHHTACGNCSNCLRISSNSHPDVKWYTSTDKILKVNLIEDAIADSSLTALESATKVLIIPTADRLNPSAQNKFLKTLEEPPKDVIILLGAINDAMLLQTIKSRCKKLHINIWNPSNIAVELAELNYDQDKINFAVNFAQDSLEKAISVISGDKQFTRYNILIDMLSNLTSSKQVPDYIGFLGNNAEANDSLTLLESIFGKLVEDHTQNADNPLCKIYKKSVAIDIIFLINDSIQRLASNCSITTIENNFLFTLLETKYKYR